MESTDHSPSNFARDDMLRSARPCGRSRTLKFREGQERVEKGLLAFRLCPNPRITHPTFCFKSMFMFFFGIEQSQFHPNADVQRRSSTTGSKASPFADWQLVVSGHRGMAIPASLTRMAASPIGNTIRCPPACLF
jgi:hypothetical protein